MRILYTVQRYGEDVVGGSESACRSFAEHLSAVGYEVAVVTSCARNYVDWADEYEAGTTMLNGVTVHRLPVRTPRRDSEFAPLNAWTIEGPHPIPLFQQQRWLRFMGPDLEGYGRWLRAHAAGFDIAIHMTYMYRTATAGLPLTSDLTPTILQPTAHNEPAIWVRAYDTIFRLADSLVFLTPEEQRFVTRRFGADLIGAVVGLGIDIDDVSDDSSFRTSHGLDGPFLLYLGRMDPSKGAFEALGYFLEFKRRNRTDLKLVLAGDEVVGVPNHPDVVNLGFLDENEKRAALAGALALVQPSYFESFSIVLCEAWVQARPALVQAGSDVLAGHAWRSGGAIPYRGFAEFEAATSMLLRDPRLAADLGRNGRAYVQSNYTWPAVVARLEGEIGRAQTRFAARRAHLSESRGVRATRA